MNELQVGMVFKSYKELCEFLGEPIKTGRSKQLQMDEFEKVFKHTKSGWSIEITEVFKQDEFSQALSQGTKNSVYSVLVQKLVMDSLAKNLINNNDSVLFMSKTHLALESGFINPNFIRFRENRCELVDYLGVNEWVIDEHYNTIFTKASNAVNNGLKALSRASAIAYYPDTIMISNGYDEPATEATPKEIGFILKAEDIALRVITKRMKKSDKYNIKKEKLDKTDILLYGQFTPFIKSVKRVLRRMHERNSIPRVYNYYRVVKIVLSDNFLSQRKRMNEYILNNRQDVVDEINSEFYRRNIDAYKRLHLKSLLQFENKEFKNIENVFTKKRVVMRANPEFIAQTHSLLDFTVKK